MSKPDPSLFQIGEVAKLMGVSRKMILHYEELELLTPAHKDENSGYRYYSADNLTQIRSIRALQSLGLSLPEVREYYYDKTNIEAYIKRLTDLRTILDRNIRLLELRASERGEMIVRHATLPQQVCFCRRYICRDTAEAAVRLRETYIDTARTGLMQKNGRMFTVRMNDDPAVLDLLCCIPIDECYDGPERMAFEKIPCICIYYRGPYEGTGNAISVLKRYTEENGIVTAGHSRSVYLEGPPNRGENAKDFSEVIIPDSVIEDSAELIVDSFQIDRRI